MPSSTIEKREEEETFFNLFLAGLTPKELLDMGYEKSDIDRYWKKWMSLLKDRKICIRTKLMDSIPVRVCLIVLSIEIDEGF